MCFHEQIRSSMFRFYQAKNIFPSRDSDIDKLDTKIILIGSAGCWGLGGVVGGGLEDED